MIPRIVVAGTQSGVGKTLIASGLMQALAARGLRVQGFKAGPDFVDPVCHGWATGRPGRNLDTWLMRPDQIAAHFARGAADADIAVIEGVMGMYDGAGGTDEAGSTAHLAKLLGAPVVLVVDAAASARSVAAVALGFKMLDPEAPLGGVICNRVGSERHAEMLAEALASVSIPMLGAVHRDEALRVPADRLGLSVPGGEGGAPAWIGKAGTAMAAQVDLVRLLALAQGAGALPDRAASPETPDSPFAPDQLDRFRGLRLAVARDAAFWFYYEETFELLRYWGAEPVFFSPLTDGALPPDVDGIYLGGGFPERHAGALAANEGLRQAIRRAGVPILAEGGGYLYLLEALTDETGSLHAMVGIAPGVARLHPRLQGLGYRQAEPDGVKGHLFHYTRVEGASGPPAFRLWRSNGAFEREDGFRQGAVLASYLHLHHATHPSVMASFLTTCKEGTRHG